MHPTGNFTTIVLTRGRTGTCAASWELGEWREGQISCRNVGDIVGLGAWQGLVLMENGHIKRPTLHLCKENQVPALLISILSVTIVAPLEIVFKWMVLYGGDGVRRHLRRGLQEGTSALPKQGQGRDRHRNQVEHKAAWPQPPRGLHFTPRAGPHLEQTPT